MKKALLYSAATFLAISTLPAQTTTWTDGASNQEWSDAINWSSGVPISTSNVQIGVQPTDNQIGIDTGSTVIASLAFDNTLSRSMDITGFSFSDTLQVNGAITNNSSFTHSFSLPVFAGAGSSVWTGNLSFQNSTTIGIAQVTLANTISFSSGTNLNFDITNSSTYGRFLGSGSAAVTGVFINIGGSYTGVNGDTFDFTSGNFSGATLVSLPTLTGGLTWDSSNFLTNGTLSVVPEPGTVALATLGLTALVIFRRRRKD